MYSHNPPQMYGNKSMKILKFIVQETGTYNQQWKRPFSSGMAPSVFNSIVNSLDNVKSITPAALTGVANEFIRPAAQPESNIFIPNGWNERRCRFYLEVQTESQIGAIQTIYLVGWTDYAGLGANNSIDPAMIFTINSSNITRTSVQHTPLGNQVYQNVIDSSHVIVNDAYQGLNTGKQLYSLRPEEVFTQMDTADISQEIGSNDIFDTQLQLTRTPLKSRRTNAVAPVYVAKILNSYIQTQKSEPMSGSRIDLLESAKATVASDAIASDPFISYIRNKGDNSGNSFRYGDLVALDPNVLHNTKVLSLTPTTRSTLHQTGQTADWAAANGETVFATSIGQSLPGYMLEHCIQKLYFKSTNQDIGGVITTKIEVAKSLMTGVDITPYVQSLIFKIENELLRGLSFNGQMGFAVDIRCDLLGETWINLSINSQPFVMYVTPSFCDALMTPITTGNPNTLAGISSDFSNLLDSVGLNGNSAEAMHSGNFGKI